MGSSGRLTSLLLVVDGSVMHVVDKNTHALIATLYDPVLSQDVYKEIERSVACRNNQMIQ